jgi:hypothetical protein
LRRLQRVRVLTFLAVRSRYAGFIQLTESCAVGFNVHFSEFTRLGRPRRGRMTEDFALETDPGPCATKMWWARRRLRYNAGLLVAGVLGFVFYAIAVDRCIDLRAPGDWEITLFTTFFQGFAYLIMVGVANLCYYLGPWSEKVVRPTNVARYRKIAFWLGFWFSVLLPFTPAAVLFVSCALQAGRTQ